MLSRVQIRSSVPIDESTSPRLAKPATARWPVTPVAELLAEGKLSLDELFGEAIA